MPVSSSGDAKINTIWPLLSSKFALFTFYKHLRKLCRHKHVHFIDEEAEAGWGHIPGSTKVKTGTPTFFLQVQCSAHSLTHWHDWDETQRGFGWPKGNHWGQPQCLRTSKLAFDPVLTSQCIPFSFFIQMFSTVWTHLWFQSWLSDTLQELLKCSLKNCSLLIAFWNDPVGESVWPFLKRFLSEFKQQEL